MLAHTYQPRSVHDLLPPSLSMSASMLLHGPSGSGKTTCLSLFPCIERWTPLSKQELRTFCQTRIPHQHKLVALDNLDSIPWSTQYTFVSCIDKYKHVQFVATCVTIDLILPELRTRLLRVALSLLSYDQLRALLSRISTQEHIDIQEDAQDRMVRMCGGQVDELIHSVEKAMLLHVPVTLDNVHVICTSMHWSALRECTQLLMLVPTNLCAAMHHWYALFYQGYSVLDIVHHYTRYVQEGSQDILTDIQRHRVLLALLPHVVREHEYDLEVAFLVAHVYQALHTP